MKMKKAFYFSILYVFTICKVILSSQEVEKYYEPSIEDIEKDPLVKRFSMLKLVHNIIDENKNNPEFDKKLKMIKIWLFKDLKKAMRENNELQIAIEYKYEKKKDPIIIPTEPLNIGVARNPCCNQLDAFKLRWRETFIGRIETMYNILCQNLQYNNYNLGLKNSINDPEMSSIGLVSKKNKHYLFTILVPFGYFMCIMGDKARVINTAIIINLFIHGYILYVINELNTIVSEESENTIVLIEQIKETLSNILNTYKGRLLVTSIICLCLSLISIFFLKTFFRLTMLALFGCFFLFGLTKNWLSAFNTMPLTVFSVFLFGILVFGFFYVTKILEKYFFRFIFSFFGSNLVILSIFEVAKIPTSLPRVVYNYHPARILEPSILELFLIISFICMSLYIQSLQYFKRKAE